MLRTKGKRKKYKLEPKAYFRVNERIRVPEVRVIDEDGQQIGVMPTYKALTLAKEKDLDLVEVFPKSQPPVCKIQDYGQFQYQLSRKTQAQKAGIKKIETKGIRISFKIGQHDLEMRKNQALKFLSKGDKVKVEIILRGRERKYTQEAYEKVKEFIQSIINAGTTITLELAPKKLGNQISALMAPANKPANHQALNKNSEEPN